MVIRKIYSYGVAAAARTSSQQEPSRQIEYIRGAKSYISRSGPRSPLEYRNVSVTSGKWGPSQSEKENLQRPLDLGG